MDSGYLATRTLSIVGPEGGVVTIGIGLPKHDFGDDWSCAFWCVGPAGRIEERRGGVDAFQAVLSAIEALRWTLDENYEDTLTWSEYLHPGIPMFVPILGWDISETRKIERVVIEERRQAFDRLANSDAHIVVDES